MADVAAKRKVTVIGAGIVGMASAVHLQRDGHDVTVVDRVPPGDGCSFGNAGIFATASMIPVSTPGLIWSVPKYLIDPLGPLSLRWSYLPRMIPWLVSFLCNGSPARMARIADALSTLLAASVEAHQRLAAGTGAERWIRPSPYILAYENKAAFETDRRLWEMRRQRGARYDLLDGDALRQIEPALAHDFSFAVQLHDHGHALDPARLVKALAEHFLRHGGTVLERDVTDIEVGPDGPTRLLTSEGPLDIDVLVIAAGAWSARLLRPLGYRVPLESQRGYHVTIEDPGVEPRIMCFPAENKFAITPMDMGLRLGGTAEIAGLDAPPDFARARVFLELGKRILPGLQTAKYTEWDGHRPCTPDSLPLLGAAPRHPDLYFAFGHGHQGLLGASNTGRVIAEVVSGRPPSIDLEPFRADRF